MAAAKRTELVIIEDRAKICDLLMKGYRVAQITDIINEGRPEELQISSKTVRNDIDFMKRKWIESGLQDFNAWRNRIIDEIQLLKRTYWEEFELSKRDKITTAVEAIVDEEGKKEMEENGGRFGELAQLERIQTKTETREGNPAYLQGVLACNERLAKIFGIDQPDKLALTDPSGEKEISGAGNIVTALLDKMAENHEKPLQLTEGERTNELSKDRE